jgi:DNA-binding HxlR family transcriptional regulator
MALFDLLGRTWAMGVLWQMQDGPHTFRELQEKCESISPHRFNNQYRIAGEMFDRFKKREL